MRCRGGGGIHCRALPQRRTPPVSGVRASVCPESPPRADQLPAPLAATPRQAPAGSASLSNSQPPSPGSAAERPAALTHCGLGQDAAHLAPRCSEDSSHQQAPVPLWTPNSVRASLAPSTCPNPVTRGHSVEGEGTEELWPRRHSQEGYGQWPAEKTHSFFSTRPPARSQGCLEGQRGSRASPWEPARAWGCEGLRGPGSPHPRRQTQSSPCWSLTCCVALGRATPSLGHMSRIGADELWGPWQPSGVPPRVPQTISRERSSPGTGEQVHVPTLRLFISVSLQASLPRSPKAPCLEEEPTRIRPPHQLFTRGSAARLSSHSQGKRALPACVSPSPCESAWEEAPWARGHMSPRGPGSGCKSHLQLYRAMLCPSHKPSRSLGLLTCKMGMTMSALLASLGCWED